jgi:3-deoxy-7-phosphoheptulonate synthase
MDPHLDGSHDIPEGLRIARRFLREAIELGVPTATELLDPMTPQYIADLICWSAIGARTSESQTHRQLASGLSMPLGFKNATPGTIDPAIHGIQAAQQPHTFLGISGDGVASAVSTTGNPNCHIVLRGGDNGPNYSADHVAEAEQRLEEAGLEKSILIDCSHGNSGKDYRRQPDVFHAVVTQRISGTKSIIGAMLESNLTAGNQPFPNPSGTLVYGQSITDACIDWETTERIVLEAAERL